MNEGKGTHVIVRELYDAGIKPKRGQDRSNTVILRVLRNEKYVGDLKQQKTYMPNYLSHFKKYNCGKEDTLYLKNHHQPLIDRAMWDSVQKELFFRSQRFDARSKYPNRYWRSEKLKCGECGMRFVSRTKKPESENYKAWRCCSIAKHGTGTTDRFPNHIGCSSCSPNDKVLLICTKYVLRHIQTTGIKSSENFYGIFGL